MRYALCTLLLLIGLSAGLLAQLASRTSLVGNVTDAGGAAVTGAPVTALNEGTQETYSGVTNAEGYYEIPFIKSGTYTVSIKQTGFDTFSKTGILVATNQTVRNDFALKIGTVNEKIVVMSEAPAIATDDASLAETISTKATAELPLNGRNPLKLAITVPTVIPGLKNPVGNPGLGEGYIGAGTREIQNNITLDGVSIMNNLISTTTFRPSVDAILETQIQTGTYPAQYGGYLGVQINLNTKSGTNQFRGALFEFVRNNAFDARGFFEKPGTPQAPLRQNQFGFALGGPVWIPKLYNGRNKTFFFANYEGLRNKSSFGTTDSVLTPKMRQGDFSELLALRTPLIITNPLQPVRPAPAFPGNIIPPSLLSPQAQRALQYIPLPNGPGTLLNYYAAVPNSNTTNQTIDRIDQNFGEKTRLFFRYAWGNTDLLSGNANPYNGYTQPVRDRNWLIGYTQVFTPTLVNDFRLGRQHTTIDSLNFFTDQYPADAGTQLGIPGFTSGASNPGLPNLSITNYQAIGGGNQPATNWYQIDTTWQGAELLNWSRGPHSISAGAEIRKLITLRTAVNSPRGSISFNGSLTGYAAADFILGLPNQVNTGAPLVQGGASEYRDGFFIQDKWQASSRLTLTLGLRYEITTVPVSKNGVGTILDAAYTKFIPEKLPGQVTFHGPDHNNWAPRIGFAYRFAPKWVARGGFGLYYNANQMNTYTLSSTNPPYSVLFTFNNDPANPTLSLNNPTPSTAQAGLPKPNAFTINPYLPNATLNQWSFSLERGLWRNAGLDIQYLGSHGYHLDRSFFPNTPPPGPGAIDPRRPNQNFRSIRVIQNDLISNYEGLSIVFRQQFARGLTLLSSYTWSHTLDVASDSNNGGATMDPFNWRRDYGNSNWDLRHRFVTSYTYELPFLKSTSNPLLRYTVAGWQVNGVTIIQSGFPFTVTSALDTTNTGTASRPNVVGPVNENCGHSQLIGCLSLDSFANPAVSSYSYGNLGRNTFRGPGLINFDLSLFKNFPLWSENTKLQFRTEAFNVFNHPSFGNPNSSYSPGNAAFGTITGTQNNNRQLQFGLKLLF